MKIKRILLQNVKSFKNPVDILFNDDFNILIGPNGSGKSNLLDIITIVIRHFFLKGYTINEGNNGQLGYYRDIQQVNTFGNLNSILEKFYGDQSNSYINITFVVKEEDINNIKNILQNIDKYENEADNYRNPLNYFNQIKQWNIDLLFENQELSYEINNNNLQNPNQPAERLFLQYLNYFDWLMIFARNIPSVSLAPNYIYFSPYRGANLQNLQANLSGQNFYQVMQSLLGATSKTVFSLINLATLYFAEKRRKYENLALENGYIDKWNEDQEVKLVSKYLGIIGYSWSLKLINTNKNIYEIVLMKDGKEFYVNQASSGEKEIINFLLGIFAFHIKNGMIIIDEPELHLHPRWQRILLDLLIELSETTNNQFIISTHSPTFINNKSYSHIIRIYKDTNNVSNKIILKDSDDFRMKDILHIVNSTNNEKIFFSDIVILVEGITDRLVFQKILSEIIDEYAISRIVEIIEVKGKTNREKFKVFLDNLKIPNFFIADLDFINECGDENIKSLFTTNEKKIEKDVIKNPKSKDGNSLVKILGQAVRTCNMDELKQLWEYIKSFRRNIKPELTKEEEKLLRTFINEKIEDNIFILRRGDIEDYLPEGYKSKDLDNVIKLLDTEAYDEWKHNEDSYFSELHNIIKIILKKVDYI
jgi:predicted ATP-dependent endonuclease of OLD family